MFWCLSLAGVEQCLGQPTAANQKAKWETLCCSRNPNFSQVRGSCSVSHHNKNNNCYKSQHFANIPKTHMNIQIFFPFQVLKSSVFLFFFCFFLFCPGTPMRQWHGWVRRALFCRLTTTGVTWPVFKLCKESTTLQNEILLLSSKRWNKPVIPVWQLWIVGSWLIDFVGNSIGSKHSTVLLERSLPMLTLDHFPCILLKIFLITSLLTFPFWRWNLSWQRQSALRAFIQRTARRSPASKLTSTAAGRVSRRRWFLPKIHNWVKSPKESVFLCCTLKLI